MESTHTVRIGTESYSLTREDVAAAMRDKEPRRINEYYVEIEGRRFPPKQVLRTVTRTTQSFVSAVAVRALSALGFVVVRTSEESSKGQ